MADFTVVALQGVLPSALAITLDMLQAAALCAQAAGVRPVTWRLLASGPVLPLGHDLTAAGAAWSARSRLGGSVLVIPGLQLVPPGRTVRGFDIHQSLAQRMEHADARELAALAAAHHRRGGEVAASCASVLVLGEAGLLQGRQVTTHWHLGHWLQARYPGCRLDPARMVVDDGRVITAGAAMAQVDLMLMLLARRAGQAIADQVMRYLLLDHRPSQAAFAAWTHLSARDDLVSEVEALVSRALPRLPTLMELAGQLHVSPRTLSRRVRQATGQSARALVQAVRLRQARHLIETTGLPLAEVAERVGYSDASGLHRLTCRLASAAPGRLRPGRAVRR